MSRFIYYNQTYFKDKTILELGSGTGIGGLSIAKYTQATKVIMTDYTQELLDLISENSRL